MNTAFISITGTGAKEDYFTVVRISDSAIVWRNWPQKLIAVGERQMYAVKVFLQNVV